MHNNRCLPFLTVQGKHNKSCCIVTSFANSFYCMRVILPTHAFMKWDSHQRASLWTSHQPWGGISDLRSQRILTHFQNIKPISLTSYFPHKFEMWLITADACSVMVYCLINLRQSVAIRTTIQSSYWSTLRYREVEELKTPSQTEAIAPLLMAAEMTSSPQTGLDPTDQRSLRNGYVWPTLNAS